MQKTDTIDALTSEEIFRDFGLCKKKFVPQKCELAFEKIEIYYMDAIKIKKDFKNENIWIFSGRDISFYSQFVTTDWHCRNGDWRKRFMPVLKYNKLFEAIY